MSALLYVFSRVSVLFVLYTVNFSCVRGLQSEGFSCASFFFSLDTSFSQLWILWLFSTLSSFRVANK